MKVILEEKEKEIAEEEQKIKQKKVLYFIQMVGKHNVIRHDKDEFAKEK